MSDCGEKKIMGSLMREITDYLERMARLGHWCRKCPDDWDPWEARHGRPRGRPVAGSAEGGER